MIVSVLETRTEFKFEYHMIIIFKINNDNDEAFYFILFYFFCLFKTFFLQLTFRFFFQAHIHIIVF